MAVSLEDIFREFCSFGDKDAAPLMDGAKFAKMCRDMKLLDKKLTATDVDIIFAKAKPKSERKMNMEQFMVAIGMLAEKKYPGDPKSFQKIEIKLTSGAGPTTHGTTRVAGNDIVDRLTDTSKYTGSHKHRFDEVGHGKGLEGRESVAKGPGHVPPLVSAQTSYVTGCQIGEDAVDSARSKHSPKTRSKVAASGSSHSPRSSPLVGSSKMTAHAKSSPSTRPKVASSVAKASPKTQPRSTSSPKPLPKASSASTSSPKPQPKAVSVSTSSPKTKAKGSIYDKLTDSSKYTGTHKHRFDETGRGKGIYGRDTPSKGPAMSPGSASGLTSYVTGYKHENTYGK